MPSTLDTFQETAADEAQNLLVIAPPGCGKTELLARRAEYFVPKLAMHQKILALTFSNKAKANLSNRLTAVLGAERKRRYVTVHNFHGHAAELLRSHGRTLGLDPNFQMPTKRTQEQALQPFLSGVRESDLPGVTKQISDSLRSAKQGPWSDCEVLGRLQASGNDIAYKVEVRRQEEGTVFYDDLLRYAQLLLRVPEISALYSKHFAAVLVDEFQDLSLQELDLALRSCRESRSFVGDPLQGIYSWTGARPVQVERLLRRISGEPKGLGVSYRSSPRVLELLGCVSSALGGQCLEPHAADDWFEGGVTAGFTFETGVEEADYIERTARSILSKQPQASIGVICRSGWRRKPIDTAFATSDCPVTRWDLAVDDPKVIELITEGLAHLGKHATIEALESYLLAQQPSAEVDLITDIKDGIEQLAGIATAAGSLETAASQLRVVENSAVSVGPGVHILNAHTGKGQQFDWVFIPGFEDGHIPSFLAKEKAELEEEHRVLLVMLSRARHGVIMSYAKTLISKKNAPYSTKRSRWIDEVRPGLKATSKDLARHINGLPSIVPST